MKQATLKQIATTLGLNASTVSRALSNNKSISQRTREKVNELAKALEYEPNKYAIQLRTNASKLFALIVPSISNYFYNSFIAAVEENCSLNDYSLLVLQSGNSDFTLSHNLQMCRQNRVSGIFICADYLKDLDEFKKLKAQKISIIFFDKIPDTNDFHKVCMEDKKAGELAAKTIISKNKKKVFALFGNTNLSITKKRLHSFGDTIEPYENIEVKIEKDVDFLKAKQLTAKYLNTDKDIDCIFCMSDEILSGSMRSVLELNKKYPDEIGIIAISNGFFPSLYHPEITYVETSGKKMGDLAFEQMIKCIHENKEPEEIYVESVLIENGSI